MLLNEKQRTKLHGMHGIISFYSKYFLPGARSNVHKTYSVKLTKKYFILSSQVKKSSIKNKQIYTCDTHNRLRRKSLKIKTFLFTLPKKRN